MTPKAITLGEWEVIQRERDAGWDKRLRDQGKSHGVRRKVQVLADESLEAELVSDLASVRGFKVLVGDRGRSDEALWAEARRIGALILTADSDFWSDRKYTLKDSPGVIYLECANLDSRVAALALVESRLTLRWLSGFDPRPTKGMKIRATPKRVELKWWDGEFLVNDVIE